MEDRDSQNQEAIAWAGKIKRWNINGNLTAGMKLADGVAVQASSAGGYYDHNVRFRDLINPKFSAGLTDIQTAYPASEIVSVIPYNGKDVVYYRFRKFNPPTEYDKRSEYGPVEVFLEMDAGEGSRLTGELEKDADLLKKLIKAKFPEMYKGIQFGARDQLIYLPPDTDVKNKLQKMRVIG